MVDRVSHNHVVAGSIPAPATSFADDDTSACSPQRRARVWPRVRRFFLTLRTWAGASRNRRGRRLHTLLVATGSIIRIT